MNNHDNDYVISKMDALGYDYNAAVAKIGRDAAQMVGGPTAASAARPLEHALRRRVSLTRLRAF